MYPDYYRVFTIQVILSREFYSKHCSKIFYVTNFIQNNYYCSNSVHMIQDV